MPWYVYGLNDYATSANIFLNWVVTMVVTRARFPLQGLGFKPKTRTLDTSWSPLNMEAARKLCEFKDASGEFSKLQGLLSKSKSISGKHVYLELAGAGAIEVEEMIRAAAQRGEGFALDEFDQNGLLNRKLLRQSATLVARQISDDVLIGGACARTKCPGKSAWTKQLGRLCYCRRKISSTWIWHWDSRTVWEHCQKSGLYKYHIRRTIQSRGNGWF